MSMDNTDAFGRVDPVLLSRMQDVIDEGVRRMRVHLINRVGISIPIRFSEVAYITLAELTEQFDEEGSAIYVHFEFKPGGHHGLLAFDAALLDRMMGLLLGEKPGVEPTPYRWRPPTRMDLRIAERLAGDIFAGLLDALPARTGGQIRILDVSGNHRTDMPLPRHATLLDVPLDFGPPEDPFGIVTLALPAAVTHALWPDFTADRPATDEGVNRVLPLPVTLVAELGRVSMSLGDVERLAKGDLLRLGPTQAVQLTVSGRPAGIGQPGITGNTRCVQVRETAVGA